MNNLVYEDPEIVEGYIQRNALTLKRKKQLDNFSKLIKKGKILDLGCGPGHESYFFTDQGFDVVGLDFSQEMIRRAKRLRKNQKNQPKFVVGDMLLLNQYFSESEFNAVWASASLLHIKKENIVKALKNIVFVTKNNGFVYIYLKEGEGEVVVEDDIYGKPMKRDFTFWSKEEFLAEAKKSKMELFSYGERQSGGRKIKVLWHMFVFKVNK